MTQTFILKEPFSQDIAFLYMSSIFVFISR